MVEPQSIRRMVENEVVFRRYNESVQERFDELEKIAKEDGQESIISRDDLPLQFYCECSDENCRKRVQIRPSRYNEIHIQRDRFVVVPGHETLTIEMIVGKEADFYIVEKFTTPPENVEKLQKTDVQNV